LKSGYACSELDAKTLNELANKRNVCAFSDLIARVKSDSRNNRSYIRATLVSLGINTRELKGRGYSLEQIFNLGFDLSELKQAYMASEIADVAVKQPQLITTLAINAATLKEAGVPVSKLAELKFSVEKLKAAGFSIEEMIPYFNSDQLLGNYKLKELIDHHYGIANYYNEHKKSIYVFRNLQEAYVSATQVRKYTSATDEQLMGEFSFGELDDAGISKQAMMEYIKKNNSGSNKRQNIRIVRNTWSSKKHATPKVVVEEPGVLHKSLN